MCKVSRCITRDITDNGTTLSEIEQSTALLSRKFADRVLF